VPVLQKAAIALSGLDPNLIELVSDVAGEPEPFAKRRADVRRAIEATAEIRSLVRSARTMPGTDWGIRMQSPAMNVVNALIPNYAPQRQLCKLLRTAATHYHQERNDREAVESIRDMVAQARHIDTQPFLIAHLVALAMDGLAEGAVEEMASNLRVTDKPAAGDGALPATRSQVEALIHALIDDREYSQRFVRALLGDRAFDLDTAESLADGRSRFTFIAGGVGTPGPLESALVFIFRPMILLDTVRMMRYTTTWARAANEACWPSMRARGAPDPRVTSGVKRVTHVMSSMLVSSLDKGGVQHFRALVYLRMAGVALAIRLYDIDHGRRPATLDELVPRYLPAVPQDPFASDGRKIGYNSKARRPVLYSVGDNGVDEKGEYGVADDGTGDWRAKDLPFFLNGDRPRRAAQATTTIAPAASTQAVNK
jgi:hypothetical protein